MMDAKRQTAEVERLNDEVLFGRFKNGDHEAFDCLIQRYQGPIFAYILKSTSNRAAAEDVFQDVFFKVIERREQFRTTVSFKAWLYTIARTTCIDAARKKNRTPLMNSIYVDDENPREEKVKSQEKGQEEVVNDNETNQYLQEALKALPEAQQETFMLKAMHEMTFDEISRIMNCSINTAKSRMRYALEQLRGILFKGSHRK